MQARVLGVVLVLAGILIFIKQTAIVSVAAFITWPFIFFLVGAILVVAGFWKKNEHLVLAGGIVAAIAIFRWGMLNVHGWPSHWSILVALIGVAILLQYILTRNTLTGVIAVFAIVTGLFAWPGIKDIAALAPLATVLNTYWPILAIALGLVLFFRKEK